MARSISRTRTVRRAAATTISTTALLLPAAAWAQCTATGSNVNCTGTAASYTYTSTTNTPATVTVASGATVTAPLVANVAGSTLSNAGTISNSTATPGVLLGDNATVTNASTGVITSSGSTSGATAITVGANSTVTNNGTLTATAGTPAVNFGTNGTFINNTAANAAITGTIQFGTNSGSNIGKFYNYNTAYGLTGSVTGSGNLYVYNSGIFSGNITQASITGSSVNIVNDTGGTFSGIINTGDVTNITNNGSMSLYGTTSLSTILGSAQAGVSTLSNTGTLAIGTQASPTQVTVYGNFTQSSTGTLAISIASAGASQPTAGTSYSQLYASNASGTLANGGNVTLAGALNVNVAAGFYPSGSTYNLILADKSLTGSFSSVTTSTLVTTTSTDSSGVTTSTVTSTPLAFVSFSTGSVVALPTGQLAYQVTATHLNYATVMKAAGATSNQLAVATGLQPLVATATKAVNASTSDPSISLLSVVDIMDTTQAKTFLDTVSPEGYYGYAVALREQANAFSRAVDLRMNDQNSNHPEDGWWLSTQGQWDISKLSDTSKGFKTRDHMFGFTAGYDLSGPNHVIGLAFNASWDSLAFGANNLSGTNRDLALAIYGAQNLAGFRLSGQLAYNYGHMSATHTTAAGAYTLSAHGGASEGLFKANAELSYPINVGSYKFSPFGGVDFNKGQVNGFTESETDSITTAAALTVGHIKADRTDVLGGFSLTRNKGTFRPYARVAYRYKVGGGDNNVINAYFDGENSGTYNTSFQVTAAALGKNQVEANAGVNWVFDDAGALFVGYQGTVRDGYNSHGINFGIRLEF